MHVARVAAPLGARSETPAAPVPLRSPVAGRMVHRARAGRLPRLPGSMTLRSRVACQTRQPTHPDSSGCPRGFPAAPLVLMALVALAPPALGDGAGVIARNKDKLTASLGAGDDDSFAIELSEGGALSVKLKAAKGSDLLPEFRLFRPDGTEAGILPFLKKAGTASRPHRVHGRPGRSPDTESEREG